MAVEPESDVIAVTLRVVELLEELGVPYVIGGSLASSVHGTMRSTGDVDFVVDLKPEDVPPFVQALGDEFYVSENRVTRSVEAGGSFNVIALEPMFKVDFFVAKDKPFESSQLRRGEALRVSRTANERVNVSTPEDVVVAKLRWYRKGGEVSDRQWEDVLGVLRVKSGTLDEEYLERMAEEVGVSDLLTEALDEAGGEKKS
ncbi:MAG TPA: hypothetical protein VEK15_21465 [Vicinamibacteria bacterium]|nr:hypothetical protein [Vicinamibacteria bacterium]